MTISSRTPEGEPHRCPVCDARVRIEPSIVGRDAPCPNCRTLLWFAEAFVELSERRGVRAMAAELDRFLDRRRTDGGTYASLISFVHDFSSRYGLKVSQAESCSGSEIILENAVIAAVEAKRRATTA